MVWLGSFISPDPMDRRGSDKGRECEEGPAVRNSERERAWIEVSPTGSPLSLSLLFLCFRTRQTPGAQAWS